MNTKGSCCIAAVLALFVAFPAAAHEDEQKQPMAMPDNPAGQAVAADDQGYIKVATPAGYEAVIGRQNPLAELEPELRSSATKDLGHARSLAECILSARPSLALLGMTGGRARDDKQRGLG
jgi:hypothetical protein